MAIKHDSKADSGLTISSQLRQRILRTLQQPDQIQAIRLCANRYCLRYRHHESRPPSTEKTAIFIERYLSILPEQIDELSELCVNIGWQDLLNRVNRSIFYLVLKNTIDAEHTLNVIAWLDKAYVIHRIIEELHDRIWCLFGMPVMSWNTSAANLVIYDVIGEFHAKHLESAVQEIADSFFSTEEMPAINSPTPPTKGQWLCFYTNIESTTSELELTRSDR